MITSKLIVICGPTATGKSDFAVSLAIHIAKKYKRTCEIISTDSRQIYNHLNIGTGKISREEMREIPHHLLDIAEPHQIVSVADYKKIADKLIQNIYKRGNIPILTGGTGQYIDAVVYDTRLPEVPPNQKLRDKLELKNINELLELFEQLNVCDGVQQPHKVDLKNKRRIIRAIEILESIGQIPEITKNERFDTLWIGLDTDDDTLKQKIVTRLSKRIQLGMLDESKVLLSHGILTHKRMRTLGLEYAYISDFLLGAITEDEFKTQLYFAIWHYAKRQRTWFRKNKNIHWIHVDEKSQSYSHMDVLLTAQSNKKEKISDILIDFCA